MSTNTHSSSYPHYQAENVEEKEIRKVIEHRADAIRHKDVEGVISHFAPHSVGFSMAPPLEVDQAVRPTLEEWFKTFEGPIGYEIRRLQVTAGDDIAYAHSFNRLTGTKTDGEKPCLWFRETLCFRKEEGQWLITHEHESVPFYMDGSQRAALDLEPPAFA